MKNGALRTMVAVTLGSLLLASQPGFAKEHEENGGKGDDGEYVVAPAPEPEVAVLLLVGVAIVGAVARRRNKKHQVTS